MSGTIPSQKEAGNICDKHFLINLDESFNSYGEIPYTSLAFVFVLFNNFCTSVGVVSLRENYEY